MAYSSNLPDLHSELQHSPYNSILYTANVESCIDVVSLVQEPRKISTLSDRDRCSRVRTSRHAIFSQRLYSFEEPRYLRQIRRSAGARSRCGRWGFCFLPFHGRLQKLRLYSSRTIRETFRQWEPHQPSNKDRPLHAKLSLRAMRSSSRRYLRNV